MTTYDMHPKRGMILGQDLELPPGSLDLDQKVKVIQGNALIQC